MQYYNYTINLTKTSNTPLNLTKYRDMTKKQPTQKKNIDEATPKKDDHFDFETSFNELEKIVSTLENGQLSLEQSLDDFERGIHLTRSCQNALNNAQQKVQILLDKNGQSSLEDYE